MDAQPIFIGGDLLAIPPGAMRLLSWNCRGLGTPRAVRNLEDVIATHRPQIVSLIETKKKCSGWEPLRCRLKMRGCFAVSRLGLAGGLAVLWREGVSVNILSYSRWHIDMMIEEDETLRFTLFYDCPRQEGRCGSWELMKSISRRASGPWLIAGDFNEVLSGKKISGRRLREQSHMRDFREAVEDCGLLDLGFEGPCFTFSNRRKYPDEFRARLDRAFANNDWCSLFRRAVVRNGLAISSDHVPIIIDSEGTVNVRRKKLFRFEAIWQKVENFPDTLRGIWRRASSEEGPLRNILDKCASELGIWNRQKVGNVQRKIKELKAELEQIRAGVRTSESIVREEVVVRNLDEWLSREELLWKQRSKVTWLREGDRNTAFFHAKHPSSTALIGSNLSFQLAAMKSHM